LAKVVQIYKKLDNELGIDFSLTPVYNGCMNKTIASILILAVTILLTFVFYNLTIANYPEFGEIFNLLFLGLTLFFFGIGIFVSGLLLGQSVRENQ
jgi:hypothetical protein